MIYNLKYLGKRILTYIILKSMKNKYINGWLQWPGHEFTVKNIVIICNRTFSCEFIQLFWMFGSFTSATGINRGWHRPPQEGASTSPSALQTQLAVHRASSERERCGSLHISARFIVNINKQRKTAGQKCTVSVGQAGTCGSVCSQCLWPSCKLVPT